MAEVRRPERVSAFVRRLFGAPFENLPPEFGDTVPPELRAFEREAQLARHSGESEPGAPPAPHGRSRPNRRDAAQGRQ